MDIREFASRLGLSTTTISHALSGHRYVKPATRQLILERMREWGYTPNINAQRMIQTSTNLIAFFSEVSDMLTDPYQLELLRTFCRCLRPRDYDLILDLYHDGEEERFSSLHRRVLSHAIDGSIIIGANLDDALLQSLSASHSPCVYIDSHAGSAVLPHVCRLLVNSHDAYREAFTALRQLGRTSILYLGRKEDDYVMQDALRLMEELGLDLYGGRCLYSEENGLSAANAALMPLLSPTPPRVIMTRTHAQAKGVYEKAMQLGFSVPKDLSIISHGDERFSGMGEPSLATVSFDWQSLAERSIDQLFFMREHPETPQPNITISSHFVPMGTFV